MPAKLIFFFSSSFYRFRWFGCFFMFAAHTRLFSWLAEYKLLEWYSFMVLHTHIYQFRLSFDLNFCWRNKKKNGISPRDVGIRMLRCCFYIYFLSIEYLSKFSKTWNKVFYLSIFAIVHKMSLLKLFLLIQMSIVS